MKRRSSRYGGFTLIELLVVVSIIGLLSSVVLASLQSARYKGMVGAGLIFESANYHSFGSTAIAMWNFSESGSAVSSSPGATDSSGNNRNLFASPSVSRANFTPTGSGYSLAFTQGNSAMSAITSASLTGSDLTASQAANLTVSTWLYVSSDSGIDAQIMTMWGGTGSPGNPITITYSPSGHNLSCSSQVLGGSISFGYMPYKSWHFIACSVNASTYKMTGYLDGKLMATQTFGSADLSGSNYPILQIGVGAGFGYGLAQFSGYIGDTAVYNQTLAASQIREIYASALAKGRFALRR